MELKKHYHSKPAILLTGQHHAREVITSSMVLYTILNMIHGGVLHTNGRESKLLMQNKYYIIPTLNVDGLAYIEDSFVKTGILPNKRKTMNIGQTTCKNPTNAGVDLNRNYDYSYGGGDNQTDPCSNTYRGAKAFSEPET